MSQTIKTGLGIEDIIGDKREAILRLAEQHGAFNVRVFGSVARGEARPDSDLDLLVDWDYNRISAWGGVGFALEMETLIGHKVDVISEKWLYPELRDSILQDVVAL